VSVTETHTNPPADVKVPARASRRRSKTAPGKPGVEVP
jgi:hypothetical protein